MTDRLTSFLETLDRVSLADLEVLALPEPAPERRGPLLARVAAAAAESSTGEVVDVDAIRAGVRELMLRRLSDQSYRPTWAGLNWVASPMRMEDRAHLILAVEDAAVAAALEDRLDADDVAALREPYELAASMTGAGITGVPDLGGGRVAAAPLTAVALTTGATGIGLMAVIATLLRRWRRRLEGRD